MFSSFLCMKMLEIHFKMPLPLPDVSSKMLDYMCLSLSLVLSLFLHEDLVCHATESMPQLSDCFSAFIHLGLTASQRSALLRGEVVPNALCKHH
jgi:hypothetical protein